VTGPEDAGASHHSDTGWPSEPADRPAAPTAAAEPEPLVEPAPTEPEAASYEPELAEPELTEPEAEFSEPELAEPELAEPELAEPELTEPELAEPELTEPEAELAEPEVYEPEVYQAELTPEPAELAAEPAAAPDVIAPHSPPSPWRSVPVLALLLTTVLMVVANGFVWYQVHQHSTVDDARRAGLEASRDAARVLLSYDYRTLSKDFSTGRSLTTGEFAKKYAETTTKVVTPVATKQKAVVKAEVVTAGVVRASTSTVVTIIYVNQVTTSSLSTAPKVDLSRVRMTLRHVGGRWLVSNVEAL
jgi:Mce-associated membrane protein